MNIENNLLGNANHYVLMNIELDNMEGLYRNLLTAGSITKETFDIMMKKINEEKIINWIEFVKIQHPYLNTYKLFENPDEYVQFV